MLKKTELPHGINRWAETDEQFQHYKLCLEKKRKMQLLAKLRTLAAEKDFLVALKKKYSGMLCKSSFIVLFRHYCYHLYMYLRHKTLISNCIDNFPES